MVIVLILSYAFIMQPSIMPTDADMGIGSDTYEVEASSSYIMHYTDGSYELITPKEHMALNESQVHRMMEGGFQVIEEGKEDKK